MIINFLFLILSPSANAYPNCTGVPDSGADFNFTQSCFKHDICYYESALMGYSRASCDTQFLNHMKVSCDGNVFCLFRANTYYLAVSTQAQPEFDKMTRIGLAIKTNMIRANDSAALALIQKRSSGQRLWNSKDLQCYKLGGSAYDDCIDERDKIVVPDLPIKYKIGNCNLMGMSWKKGHRVINAYLQSRRLGTPLEDILDMIDENRTVTGEDPCANDY